MEAPRLLSEDDRCRRAAFYLQRWQVPALTPKAILRQAIEHGLQSNADDPGEAASAEAFRLATEQGLDTAETDLLGLAEHTAALANFLTWILRATGLPYKRPEPIRLPEGSLWTSGAFLSQDERSLRHIALVDRWDAWAQMALENSWQVMGECSAYQVPMSVIIVELGSLRRGRWTNPFTAGWRHPVAKNHRFQKRDGESFDGAWERVWRERDNASREDWLDAMSDDGVLAESLHVLFVETPQRASEKIFIAESKLIRIQSATEPPHPQYSMCFDRIRPCPFRNACPRGLDPSEELGFLPLHHASHLPA